MAEGSNRETTEMRYLLGTLSPDDETRIEDAFFADDTKFEELEIAEADLIDAYVQKALSPEDQRQFEAKLRASPPLLERVRFARLLKDKAAHSFAAQLEVSNQPANAVATQPRPKPRVRWWEGLLAQPAFRVAAAAGIFVIVVGGVALLLGWRNLRNESIQIASERAALEQQRQERDQQSTEQQAKTDQLAAELQRERDQRAEDLKLIEELQRANKLKETANQQSSITTFATVFLTRGSLRSGGAQQELAIGPETTTARLQLALEKNDYPTYNAAIKTADGTEVIRKNGLKPHNTRSGHQLLLSVPSRRLTPGDYTVHVDGVTASSQVENVSDYPFRVKTEK